jgi:hypothetical protein
MPASIISICNLALSHCGGFSIGALDEQSVEARLCSRHYEVCRDEVLRSFRWAFATKIKALAPVADVEYPNWEHVYAYPADCLVSRRIVTEGSKSSPSTPLEYTVISSDAGTSKYLLCDTEDAYLEYTARITDPAQFDAQFVSALSYRLAADLITGLSGDSKERMSLLQVYGSLVNEAKAASANEQVERVSYSRYVDARN